VITTSIGPAPTQVTSNYVLSMAGDTILLTGVVTTSILFESLTVAEEYTSGKSTAWAEQAITYRTSDAITGWGTSTLTYKKWDGTTGTLNAALGGVWEQKDGTGAATTPSTVGVKEQIIAEEYTSGKSTAWAEQTLYYRDGTTPSGWGTATLSYDDPENTSSSLNAALGGVWEQKDGTGAATTPTDYTY